MTKTSRLRSRLLSAALALAMLFTMAPTGAFAADETPLVVTTKQQIIDAFKTAPDGTVIQLGADITDAGSGDIILKRNVSLTLDLNDHTLSSQAGSSGGPGLITLDQGFAANLTIRDSGTNGLIEIKTGSSGFAVKNIGTGTVKLESGTIRNLQTAGRTVWVGTDARFEMIDGLVENVATGTVNNDDTIYCDGGEVKIAGGTVRATEEGTTLAIRCYDGTLTIEGGTITSKNTRTWIGTIAANSTNLTIGGGTISNTATQEGYSLYMDNATALAATITGGTIGRIYPSGIISGRVLTSDTSSPIEGASLQLKKADGTDIGTPIITGADGKYKTQSLLGNTTYKLEVTKEGYETITQSVTVNSRDVTKNIELKNAAPTIYTISFDVNAADFSGTVPAPQETNPDTNKLTSLPTITRDGYTFDGWFTAAVDGTQVTLDTVFTQDITVYAHWTKITAPTVYTITFDVNATDFSGTVPAAQTTTADTFKLTSLPTVSRSGYTFDGWFTTADGGTKITLDTVFTQNTKVYAHWTKNSTGGGSNGGGGSSGGKSSGSGTTAPASAADDFIDIQNHWAKSAIEYVVDKNLFKGITDTIFAPDAPMTRAMLWTVLARNASVDTTGGASWYEQAQLWVVSTKISDGTKPNGSITREELATILYRLAGSPDVSAMAASEFKDSSQVSAYAVDAIRWATSTGILKGTDTGRLAPKAGATRAEVATMLMRYLSK